MLSHRGIFSSFSFIPPHLFGAAARSPFNFKYNLLRQGTVTADHLTLLRLFKLRPSNQPSKNLNQPSQTINQLSQVQDQPSHAFINTVSHLFLAGQSKNPPLLQDFVLFEVAALPPPFPHTNLQLHSQATGVADKLLLSDFFSFKPFGQRSQRYKVI